MSEKNCLRCGVPMRHIMTEKLQLGKTGWILGDLPNLVAGALEVHIFSCPQCGKLEFFQAEDIFDDELPQKKCPSCVTIHDFDYPRCPVCKFEY